MVPGFVADAHNVNILRLLWLYAVRSEEFEQETDHEGDLMGFSLDKGLLIYGNVGCGKTELLRCLQKYLQLLDSPLQFGIVPLKEIAEDFASEGYAVFRRRSTKVEHWLFDDLGQTDKETVANYANRVNVAENMILARYDKFRTGTLSHFTTNMKFEELQKYYDGRVWSRLTEMCNLIMLTGPDRRPQAVPKIKHRQEEAKVIPLYTDEMKRQAIIAEVQKLQQGHPYRFLDTGGIHYQYLVSLGVITPGADAEMEAEEIHRLISNAKLTDLDTQSRKQLKAFEAAEELPPDNKYTRELAYRIEKRQLKEAIEKLASGELNVTLMTHGKG